MAPTYSSSPSGVFAVNQKCVRAGRVSTDFTRAHDFAKPVKPDAVLQDGDICINSTGTGTIGRVGLWSAPTSGIFFADTHVTVARLCPTAVVPKFFCEALLSPPIQKEMEAECFTGSTNQIELSKSAFAGLEFLLPPLGEQQKIAAILSAVDDAIEASQAVIDQLQVVKKAMMAELLTKGLPGRHKRFKKTEIGEIPQEWNVLPAGEICTLITKGTTPAAEAQASVGDIPFLKVYNMLTNGRLDFAKTPTFIPRAVHEGELRRSRVLPGDVLMNIVGPPLGKVAIVPSEHPEWNINQAIALFRVGRAVLPEYLFFCLLHSGYFSWAYSRAKRTSTQLNLTLEICRGYPVPLPTLDEQRLIVDALASVDTKCAHEDLWLDALSSVKSALLSVLLTGEVRVRVDEEDAA
ncbi:MAG: restriction endonuclease subunit S [Polyangia bacterium]|jgi:type I restriction enzyme S subunit